MKTVYVRPIRPDEAQIFFDWSVENADKSQFDPAVALFPSSSTWCAYDSTGPLVYQTLQQPIMLESVAPRPGLTPVQMASCLKELTQNAVTQASVRGAGEVYFLASDADTAEFAANKIFEELPFKIYRAKLAELEGKDANNEEG